MNVADKYQALTFKGPDEWRQWLEQNHNKADGVWLRFYKKASGVTALNYAEALDPALCYGWIDGQVKKGDEQSYWQKFTPRRPKSIWSKRNVEHVARLEKAGLMQAAGLAEVEKAKEDGRWAAAYDSPSQMTVPEDFLKELANYPEAKAFFETLNKANVYAIAWRLRTAKTEVTRRRRAEKILAMLRSGQNFH